MFQTGDVVDNRYDILGVLGTGGMAQVFRARDRHLERTVALKVLRPHLTDTDSERFRREIRALARLNHPGIVSIYDLGRLRIHRQQHRLVTSLRCDSELRGHLRATLGQRGHARQEAGDVVGLQLTRLPLVQALRGQQLDLAQTGQLPHHPGCVAVENQTAQSGHPCDGHDGHPAT